MSSWATEFQYGGGDTTWSISALLIVFCGFFFLFFVFVFVLVFFGLVQID